MCYFFILKYTNIKPTMITAGHFNSCISNDARMETVLT